jgi:hypothetical protein
LSNVLTKLPKNKISRHFLNLEKSPSVQVIAWDNIYFYLFSAFPIAVTMCRQNAQQRKTGELHDLYLTKSAQQ